MRLFEIKTSPERVGMLGVTEPRLYRVTIDLDQVVSVDESIDPLMCNIHMKQWNTHWAMMPYDEFVKAWRQI